MDYYTTKQNESKAKIINCPVSLKMSVELANFIRGKPVKKVMTYLDQVINLEKHTPIKRYNRDQAHRKGQAILGVKAGRYPVKVAQYFKKLINSAIKNAENKGIDVENLLLRGIVVSQGIKRPRISYQGKRGRVLNKSVHLEAVVKEQKHTKKQKKINEKNKIEKRVVKKEKIETKKIAKK